MWYKHITREYIELSKASDLATLRVKTPKNTDEFNSQVINWMLHFFFTLFFLPISHGWWKYHTGRVSAHFQIHGSCVWTPSGIPSSLPAENRYPSLLHHRKGTRAEKGNWPPYSKMLRLSTCVTLLALPQCSLEYGTHLYFQSLCAFISRTRIFLMRKICTRQISWWPYVEVKGETEVKLMRHVWAHPVSSWPRFVTIGQCM